MTKRDHADWSAASSRLFSSASQPSSKLLQATYEPTIATALCNLSPFNPYWPPNVAELFPSPGSLQEPPSVPFQSPSNLKPTTLELDSVPSDSSKMVRTMSTLISLGSPDVTDSSSAAGNSRSSRRRYLVPEARLQSLQIPLRPKVSVLVTITISYNSRVLNTRVMLLGKLPALIMGYRSYNIRPNFHGIGPGRALKL